VDLTDQIIVGALGFIRNLNSNLSVTKFDQFVFQRTDYLDVAVKEVNEIRRILAGYEIFVK
jgi:hypothetical protein